LAEAGVNVVKKVDIPKCNLLIGNESEGCEVFAFTRGVREK
jgi:hypothetical protein